MGSSDLQIYGVLELFHSLCHKSSRRMDMPESTANARDRRSTHCIRRIPSTIATIKTSGVVPVGIMQFAHTLFSVSLDSRVKRLPPVSAFPGRFVSASSLICSCFSIDFGSGTPSGVLPKTCLRICSTRSSCEDPAVASQLFLLESLSLSASGHCASAISHSSTSFSLCNADLSGKARRVCVHVRQCSLII